MSKHILLPITEKRVLAEQADLAYDDILIMLNDYVDEEKQIDDESDIPDDKEAFVSYINTFESVILYCQSKKEEVKLFLEGKIGNAES